MGFFKRKMSAEIALLGNVTQENKGILNTRVIPSCHESVNIQIALITKISYQSFILLFIAPKCNTVSLQVT